MRLIYLNTFWTILLDSFLWLVIHLGVVWVMTRFSEKRFDPKKRFYLPRSWERDLRLYEKVLRIKKWKEYLPDGARSIRKGGSPKNAWAAGIPFIWRGSSRRPAGRNGPIGSSSSSPPLFFLWNRVGVGWVMIFYALAENLPLILAQRYNRFRLLRILSRCNRSSKKTALEVSALG
jgi:glycosyl-4,4'-diaponeurosporenoate acyltransferase